MKKKTGFLGTVYGVDVYADTKDDVVLKQIGKYLEEQKRAYMGIQQCKDEKDLLNKRSLIVITVLV